MSDSLVIPIDILTPEFLYKAFRPHMSWEINANKTYWEDESWKLRLAIISHLNSKK